MAQYDLGVRFGRSLSRGAGVFVGTVKAVTDRVDNHPSQSDPSAPTVKDVKVSVDDWLWGDESLRKAEVSLVRISRPNTIQFRTDEGWSAWDGVEVHVNDRLLISFYDGEAESGASQAKLTKYGLILSEERRFQSVRDALALHAMLAQNPQQISMAPELIGKNKDPFLAGYVVSYLTLGIRPYSVDAEASVLTELLGRNDLPKAARLNNRVTLTAKLLSNLYPVSQETRDSVTKALIGIASSEDMALAKQAVVILVGLSDKRKLNMRPFLDGERRKRLNKVYLTAFNANVRKAHPDFESQLRATSP